MESLAQTVRAASLTGYVEVAQAVGLDPHFMLRAHRLSPQLLEHPEWRLEAEAVVSLIEESAEQAGRPDLCMLLANCRSFASIGPVALLLEHLPTPRDVIAALGEFRHLLNDIVTSKLEEHGDIAVLQFNILSERSGLQVSALVLALAFRALTESSGGRWRPAGVHLMHKRPPDTRPFDACFQSRVEFDSDFDGFSFPERLLDAPNPGADDHLARHARSLLELMGIAAPPDGILDHTRAAISLAIGQGHPTLASVAANLGLSTRSLQRALEREGSKFADLLNDRRRQLALRYLGGSSLSIAAVADMVGYAGSSSFSRWFASEFGETPLAWRLRLQSGRRKSG